MADATLTRTVDGLELPSPGTFELDAVHSHVGFSVRHMMVSRVRGRFSSFAGRVTVADDLTDSSVEVTIDVASIDTRDETRDAHLRSPDFFDAEKWDTMTYRSRSVTVLEPGKLRVQGDLTIRDVTRPVELDVDYEGVGQDPWGNQRFGFTATTEIDREAFGLTWNQPLETGGVVVGKTVRIDIEAEAVRPA